MTRGEDELLAQARRDLAPSPERVQRLLNETQRAIAAGATGPASLGEPSVLMPVLRSAALRNAAAWTAIAVVSAVLGYKAGFVAGEQEAREQSVRARQAVAAPAPAPRSERAPQPARAPHVEPDVVAGPALEPPVVRKPRAKDAAPSVAAQAPAITSSSLDAEVKALRSVERALRNREPKRALELLAQLDGIAAEGQLMEERAAARAMAQCEERAAAGEVDQATVMQRVLDFSQRYPASVYFARVRRTCLATIGVSDPIDSGTR